MIIWGNTFSRDFLLHDAEDSEKRNTLMSLGYDADVVNNASDEEINELIDSEEKLLNMDADDFSRVEDIISGQVNKDVLILINRDRDSIVFPKIADLQKALFIKSFSGRTITIEDDNGDLIYKVVSDQGTYVFDMYTLPSGRSDLVDLFDELGFIETYIFEHQDEPAFDELSLVDVNTMLINDEVFINSELKLVPIDTLREKLVKLEAKQINESLLESKLLKEIGIFDRIRKDRRAQRLRDITNHVTKLRQDNEDRKAISNLNTAAFYIACNVNAEYGASRSNSEANNENYKNEVKKLFSANFENKDTVDGLRDTVIESWLKSIKGKINIWFLLPKWKEERISNSDKTLFDIAKTPTNFKQAIEPAGLKDNKFINYPNVFNSILGNSTVFEIDMSNYGSSNSSRNRMPLANACKTFDLVVFKSNNLFGKCETDPSVAVPTQKNIETIVQLFDEYANEAFNRTAKPEKEQEKEPEDTNNQSEVADNKPENNTIKEKDVKAATRNMNKRERNAFRAGIKFAQNNKAN